MQILRTNSLLTESDAMRISYNIENYITNSGKQAITWHCENCHLTFINLSSFFYASTLAKDDLDNSLSSFVAAINNNSVKTLFKKQSTANKLYDSLCNCTEGVINIEYLRSLERANAYSVLKEPLAELRGPCSELNPFFCT